MFKKYFLNESNNFNNHSNFNSTKQINEKYNPKEIIGFLIGAGIKIKKEEYFNDKVVIHLFNDYGIDLIKNNFKQLDIKDKKIILYF